jgi:predicted DNA-binding protein
VKLSGKPPIKAKAFTRRFISCKGSLIIVIKCITINLYCQAHSITSNLFFVFADTLFMAKEQISIRLNLETLQKLDALAAIEKRTRNNMLEVLISEAIMARLSETSEQLFEQLKLLSDGNLTGPESDLAIKRAKAVSKAARQQHAEYKRILQAKPEAPATKKKK